MLVIVCYMACTIWPNLKEVWKSLKFVYVYMILWCLYVVFLVSLMDLIFRLLMFWISAYFVASMCIEYCRGTEIHQYSVLGQNSCTCGSLLAGSNSSSAFVSGNDWMMCSRSSSNTMIGANTDAGYLKYHN